ncbi:dihydrofolate reductase [Amorphus orientalis]|uniref:Dihydrofolate reductase n=1 Tax=Amorphus orientalis TaxID=649198 RepID=A0AAE3VNG5_9HYPH|nr:dihydrofolate reductase [Amorphus orientalis]MDQ0315287.1 dihydrofolate reductase [Amorphus orientalis]
MAEPAPDIVLVAAVARNGVIGRDNDMPWRLSTDLKRFKALTMGCPMIMGRKTFQAIGKPLPGRRTIVVTRNAGFSTGGIEIAESLDAALTLARSLAGEMGAAAIPIVGGGEIYAAAMPLADRLEITEVDCSPDGDARFPQIDPGIWRETARNAVPAGEKDDFPMAFVSYVRRTPEAGT